MNRNRTIISIYCAGGIKKGPKDATKLLWGEKERQEIQAILTPLEVVFMRPDLRRDDIANDFTVFGRDHYQVQSADYVIVDGREKRGIGVGIEMLSAKWFKRPLICVVPPNSHYRRPRLDYLGGTVRDYIHPHLASLADIVVDDFASAAKWIASFEKHPLPVKTISVIRNGINEYKKQQKSRDIPMSEIEQKINKRKT